MRLAGLSPVLRWVLVGLFCYGLFVQAFFICHFMNGLARPLSSLIIVPAATAQGRTVSYHEVVVLAHGMKGFAGAQTKKEAFDSALRVSVSRLYLKDLAKELGVKVTQEELDAYPVDQAAIASQLEIAKWSAADYRRYIVTPLLLAQKTEVAMSTSEAYQVEALEAMESLRKKLAQGMPLADVAENFSQDQSALVRGDMGIMSMGDLPTWLVPASTLAPGDISGILSSPEAYWTVSLIEYYPSDVPELAAIHFRGIAVKKKTFGTVLADAVSTNPALVFVW